MLVRLAAYQAAMIAAFLFLLPGHIGAGEMETRAFPKIRLAALVDMPARTTPPADHGPVAFLDSKWRTVRERMRQEQRLVALCRNDPTICPSDAATSFMAIVDSARLREGRALLGDINRAVNLAVRPVPDSRRHGEADVWTSPLATLATGQGDCEDYAIAKLAALWAAGIAEGDTRLVIVHDARAREDHALALVRLDGRWLALDNRRFTLIDAAHLTYRPLYAIGGTGIQTFAGHGSWANLGADPDDGRGAAPAMRAEDVSSGISGAPVLL